MKFRFSFLTGPLSISLLIFLSPCHACVLCCYCLWHSYLPLPVLFFPSSLSSCPLPFHLQHQLIRPSLHYTACGYIFVSSLSLLPILVNLFDNPTGVFPYFLIFHTKNKTPHFLPHPPLPPCVAAHFRLFSPKPPPRCLIQCLSAFSASALDFSRNLQWWWIKYRLPGWCH